MIIHKTQLMIQKGPLHNGNNVLLSTMCMSNDYIHVQLILPRIREVIKLIWLLHSNHLLLRNSYEYLLSRISLTKKGWQMMILKLAYSSLYVWFFYYKRQYQIVLCLALLGEPYLVPHESSSQIQSICKQICWLPRWMIAFFFFSSVKQSLLISRLLEEAQFQIKWKFIFIFYFANLLRTVTIITW